MEDLKLAAQLFDKEAYYKDRQFGSFSGIKVFSKCETLFRDIFIDKTYEEPEQDYFIYGGLVDAMVTEPEDYVKKHFIRVERKVKPEDALKIENQIKELELEITTKEAEIAEKPNKTTEKGIASRKEKVIELKTQMGMIKEYADKQQVTNSIWENAEETALALKTHPSYSNMVFNEFTSQQVFVTVIDGIPLKGKLDHLYMSPAMTKIYALFVAKQITDEEMRAKIKELNPNDHYACITDIKTCRDVAMLEPYNNQYRGQLGFYQDLVSNVLGIPVENIKCRILVADKLSSTFKKAELFEYDQASLNELKADVKAWTQLWWKAVQTKTFVSAKAKHGMGQKCYTCSECRFCPFSNTPGQPVMISGPRFGDLEKVASGELSTADALLDY